MNPPAEKRHPRLDGSALEALPAPACLIEAVGFHIVACNRRYLALLAPAWASAGVAGHALGEVLTGESREQTLAACESVRRSGRSAQFRHCLPGTVTDGAVHLVQVGRVPDSPAGSGWQLITMWELSAQIRAERSAAELTRSLRNINEKLTVVALEARTAAERETEARNEALARADELAAVFSAVPDMLFVFSSEGQILRANPAAERLLGFDPVGLSIEGLGRRLDMRTLEGGALDPAEMAVAHALHGDRVAEKVYAIRNAQQREMLIAAAASPIKHRGRIAGAVTTWREVTERERLISELNQKTAALAEADRHKDEFLAMLGHELRNPLAPICNSLYILDRVTPGGDQALRAKAIIDRQIAQITHLVNDLIDVARITRDKIRLQKTVVEINELARRAAEDHSSLFEQSDLTLEVRTSDRPAWVKADGARIAQVIGNLLQNAAKFTDHGGEVVLSVRTEQGSAEVSVRDTGIGIEPAMLSTMFQPFVQEDRSLDRSRGGLGLGLALAKRLVELHDGTIEARSGGRGQGAEFIFRLPLVAAPEPSGSEGKPGVRPQGRRVLVVEDNRDAAVSLRDVLRMFGHRVVLAETGSDALTKARDFRPEVVLCDIGLPGMDGHDVARAFRADPVLSTALLVALTGYASAEDRQVALEAGFDGHLAKPPDLEHLSALLAAPSSRERSSEES